MATKKVLLSGSVGGKFQQLFNRVAAVNKSNGPFDLLICCGNFLPDSEEEATKALQSLQAFVQGEKQVPLPTYFTGANGAAAKDAIAMLEDPESKAQIFYLGPSGVQNLQGFNVAYLEGSSNTADVAALEKEVLELQGDVDFFVTCDWPANVPALCAPGSVPQEARLPGDRKLSELALKVRPRYHVAGGQPAFFARVPYLNKDLGAGAHVTRFIGLAEVGNTRKQKSLHALGLQPAASMDKETLQQVPAGTTPSPYTALSKRPAEEPLNGQNWRWQDNKRMKFAEPSLGRPDIVKDDTKTVFVGSLPFQAQEEDIIAFFSACGQVEDVRRGSTPEGKLQTYGFVQFTTAEAAERACELTDRNFMGRELAINPSIKNASVQSNGDPVAGCWFCLSSEHADTHLVVSIGEEMYVAMDKGPINEQHVLVLPIEHRANSLQLSSSAFMELERYLSALRSCFAAKGQEFIAFERFMTFKKKGGNHAQFNVMSVPLSKAQNAKTVIMQLAEEHGFSMKEVPGPTKGEEGRAALRKAVGTGEYFQVMLPDGSRIVQTISGTQRHPVTFGREAAAKLVGVPDRFDWKVCQGDKQQEEKMVEKFKAAFKQYDIMS